MTTNSKIAVAVAGGYLLGRTKKAKLAFGLGMMLAGKKISLDPQQLAKALADSPLLSGLNAQARKELVDAAKAAATKAVTNRANDLADSLHDRTLSLRGEREEEPAEDEDGAEAEGETEDEGGEEAEEERERAPKARRTAPAKKAAKAPAKKTTSQAASKAPAKNAKTAAKAPARRTRKTASSSAARTQKTSGGRRG
ncbi:hypothetical protein HUT19_17185 [Streptomyces sp. NA02950]|uniref:hypothetical protein n=1 Tax=Streptomyces sp. NA02950 TaxID=2742137 RepID=UPI0015921525|nr:hypothetical protein [Streptomyces sp. NA02950]QKV93280.1 hypothetical protein HUT19_17185 [Streptomyces sp. NA02950]